MRFFLQSVYRIRRVSEPCNHTTSSPPTYSPLAQSPTVIVTVSNNFTPYTIKIHPTTRPLNQNASQTHLTQNTSERPPRNGLPLELQARRRPKNAPQHQQQHEPPKPHQCRPRTTPIHFPVHLLRQRPAPATRPPNLSAVECRHHGPASSTLTHNPPAQSRASLGAFTERTVYAQLLEGHQNEILRLEEELKAEKVKSAGLESKLKAAEDAAVVAQKDAGAAVGAKRRKVGGRRTC
jgi:hypothetical protein